MGSAVDRSEIVFFDLETTIPTRPGQAYAILEFGSILVCPKKLTELDSYETLVRPLDLSLITAASIRCNGITAVDVVSCPTFSEIADKVHDILHGRIWAGHNILRFDCVRLMEAYAQINRPPPVPKGTIDTLTLLTQTFGRRAGNMKMASLAEYFGLGQQSHRSLGDVRMNFEVVKHCATVLFLESSQQDTENNWASLNASTINTTNRKSNLDGSGPNTNPIVINRRIWIQILHRDVPLQIHCDGLQIRFGLSTQFVDHAGNPRLSFVVDANSSNLCNILDSCDNAAKRFMGFDGNLEWRPVVSRKPGFYNSPTIRLHLPTVAEDTSRWITEIYYKNSSSIPSTQQLVSNRYADVAEVDSLFHPGSLVDAYFSLDPYSYQQNAGIRLVAKKLIIHGS
ncbi:hypothetical protein SSX86_013885 [Deinandra increscens subsp. villosa]|uniref:Exonuclease domain-containing protein n=1 Tax=Deinandra increscens subsp. villosa TaxID=3103831 RepID=A0AAP0D5C9_9ASTR